MILYLGGLVLMAVIRKYHTDQFGELKTRQEWKSIGDTTWLILIGISMFLPLVSYQTDWLVVADRPHSTEELILGVVIHLIAAWLWFKSHHDSGRHWHMSLGIRHDHELVTSGIYSRIRHPMYTAHLLWGIAILLIVPNWVTGSLMLILIIGFTFFRISREEKMLVDEFGETYRSYRKETGALFPSFSAK